MKSDYTMSLRDSRGLEVKIYDRVGSEMEYGTFEGSDKKENANLLRISKLCIHNGLKDFSTILQRLDTLGIEPQIKFWLL